jgi:hypothetical protein
MITKNLHQNFRWANNIEQKEKQKIHTVSRLKAAGVVEKVCPWVSRLKKGSRWNSAPVIMYQFAPAGVVKSWKSVLAENFLFSFSRPALLVILFCPLSTNIKPRLPAALSCLFAARC